MLLHLRGDADDLDVMEVEAFRVYPDQFPSTPLEDVRELGNGTLVAIQSDQHLWE